MLKTFLQSYFDGFHRRQLPFDRHDAIIEEWQSEGPVLHIRRWRYLRKERLEIIVKSFSAVVFGKQENSMLLTCSGTHNLPHDNLFELMRIIEKEEKTSAPYFGFLAYDLYRLTEPVGPQKDFYNLPDFYLLFPAQMLIINHDTKQMWYCLSAAKAIVAHFGEEKKCIRCGTVEFQEKEEDYLVKIKKIRQLINEGEVYQINYTTRLSAACQGSGYGFFRALDKRNPAPFSLFARLPQCQIISNSPERFVMLDGGTAVTEPIKGTIKRYDNPGQDKQATETLLSSEKDDAELSMIVDLLRNDLSKVCRPGSVVVEAHKRLKTFRNVHHLVSTVRGGMRPRKTFVDLLEAVFPGGSISGCPKTAALRYIRELEEHNRSFYTGSFFIANLQPDTFDSSILIRTGILLEERIHFQVGGGIVFDSDPQMEYAECLAKADSFIRTVTEEGRQD